MSGETERESSGWTIDTLRVYLLNKIESNKELQDAKWKDQYKRNQDSNEWRGTIGDLKRDFVSRTEYDALVTRFSADQLATARTLAVTAGEKGSSKDYRDDWKSVIAIAIAVGVAVLEFLKR